MGDASGIDGKVVVITGASRGIGEDVKAQIEAWMAKLAISPTRSPAPSSSRPTST